MNIQATIVFQKNWEAIHALNENGERKYRYIINRGSSRSSKTYSLIDCYDLYARSNKNKRLTVWRDTKTDCKKTVLQDVLKRLKTTSRYKVGQDFNKTESIFTYSTDSTFEIHGTDDEETVHGLTQAGAWLNEPYKISRETFDQIDQRTSDFVIIDYNPKKGHWVEDLMLNERAIVIDSTFLDNPFCPEESRLKILSYQTVKQTSIVRDKLITENEAFEYDIATNTLQFTDKQLSELIRCRDNHAKRTANEFNWSVYGLGEKAERPNRIFRWSQISPEDYKKLDYKIWYGTDWGAVDPWAIVECKYNDGKLYVRELNYDSENLIRERMNTAERAQISTDEEGLVTYMFNKKGMSTKYTVVCDSNRPKKIMALRRNGWQAFGANKPKGSIIDGIDMMQNLDIYYTTDSENIEYEQENYSREIGNDGTILDEPEDMNNHCMDAIRYVVLHLHAWGIIKKV